jgi:hypothetical protein
MKNNVRVFFVVRNYMSSTEISGAGLTTMRFHNKDNDSRFWRLCDKYWIITSRLGAVCGVLSLFFILLGLIFSILGGESFKATKTKGARKKRVAFSNIN